METFRTLIGPDTGDATVLQLCFRAAILFAFGILCIRIAGRRTFSQITPLDIIVASRLRDWLRRGFKLGFAKAVQPFLGKHHPPKILGSDCRKAISRTTWPERAQRLELLTTPAVKAFVQI
jgi:hypothetical protein